MDKIDIYFQKGSLHHHLYLIEGDLDLSTEILFDFFDKNHGMQKGSSHFFQKNYEKFLVDDARGLKELSSRKNSSGNKQVFILSINSTSDEAQNAMLKSLEEPVSGTYYFLIFPTLAHVLDTIKSRSYILDASHLSKGDEKLAHKIISANFAKRQEMIKEFAKLHENGEIGRDHILKLLKAIIEHLKDEKGNLRTIERLTEINSIAQRSDVGLKAVYEAILYLTPYKK